jgi:hypothetical protein
VYASLANCGCFFRTDLLLKSQRRVECHRIRAGVRDRICQQNDLILRLGEARAMDLLKPALVSAENSRGNQGSWFREPARSASKWV